MKTGLGAIVCVLMLSAAAATAAGVLRGVDLEKIVETETNETGGSPFFSRVITASELARLGAANVAEALAMASDVNVVTDEYAESIVYLRGARMTDVAILVDGLPIQSAFDGRASLEAIPVAAVDRIIITFGTGSMLLGPANLGGVINVVTRSGGPVHNLNAGGRVSDDGDPQVDLAIGGSTHGFGYFVSGSFQQSDGYKLSDRYEAKRNEDGNERNNSDRRGGRFLGKLSYTPVQPTTFYTAFDYQDQAYGIPQDIRFRGPSFLRTDTWRRWTFSVGNKTRIGDKTELGLRFFWKGLGNVLDSYDNATYEDQYGDNAFKQKRQDDTWGLVQLGAFDFGQWSTIRYAARYQRDTYRSRLDRKAPWDKYGADLLSISVEDEVRPIDELIVLAGFGADGQFPFFASGQNEGDTAWSVGGMGGLFWVPTALFRLHGSVSGRTRLANLAERYVGEDHGRPDTGLEPESALNAEIGARISHVWVAASLVGFFSDSSNLIVPERMEGGTLKLTNAGGTRSFGGTMDLTLTPLTWLGWDLSYTYLSAQNTSSVEPYDENDKLEYRPDHKLFTRLALTAPWGTTGDVIFRVVGRQNYIDPNDGKWDVLDAYYLLDLRVGQYFFKHFEVWGSARNVLDFNYEAEYGFPQRGRTLWVGLRADVDLMGAPAR